MRLLVLCVLLIGAGAARADPPSILVWGDSISAGYGIRVAQGWVALLQAKIREAGYGYQVINASVSGETTAGGLARLPRALALHHPQIVILELGGNDGLRALPVADMRANLASMVSLARAAGARVLLLGIFVPPNYGPEYTDQFRRAFSDLARGEHVAFVPFLLQDVALDAALMQDDGIHPNEAGQPRLLANLWPALQPLLAAAPKAAHSAP
jgi:acyl-CoA thioesterase-1